MNNTTSTAVITKTLKIEAEGKGAISLQPKDYVVSGGEGAIYKPLPDVIIKLYHDRDKMRKDGMPQKISLLSKVDSPFIVSPKGLVLDNQLPIGYWMKYETGESLAKVITSAYRQRENFGDKDAIVLVDNMREAVNSAHYNKAILVDANELNWLVNRQKKDPAPKLLDVDSWKIGAWDASVIMMSIRDWHTHGFDEGSDWFSWAIVTFQVFSGIHPYKGSLPGFKMNDIESRMKANKSVFEQAIKLNSAVRDFNTIPSKLLDWYEAVFQQGDRSAPPSAKDISNKTPRAALKQRGIVITGTNTMLYDKLYDNSSEIPIYLFPCGVVRTHTDKLIDLGTKVVYQHNITGTSCEIISTSHGLLVAEIFVNGIISFTLLNRDGTATSVPSVITGSHLVRSGNRLFVAGLQGLSEVTIKMFAKPTLAIVQTWQYLYNSTNWFHGVGIQDALGAMFLIVPFSDRSVEYLRTRELDGKKIINAMAGTRYTVVITLDTKTGEYSRHEFIFTSNYQDYIYKHAITSSPELNVAILPKGIIVYIPDDGHLTIEVPTANNRTEIKDPKIRSSFTLFNWENRVVYIDGNEIWAVSSK